MASLYASVAPQFTRELLSPGLRVGYTDEGGVWQFVAPSLCQRLPLRAIEWRNLVGVTKRIDQLPLHFVEISPENVKKELPPTCIYLVKCEDLDSYKSVVRPPLAAWVDAMTAAKAEWLVLYVPLGTRPKAAGNTPNPVYRKVFDRLRADFTHRRNGPTIGPASTLQERVCKIDTLEGTSVVGQQQQHESQWTELLLRLRHCVMEAFQTKCFQYEERLRVLDAKRGAPGWDFGAFFLAKERLALMYQQMYLQDDAIRHLDELDAIFMNLNEVEMQTFRDGSKSSFTVQDPIFTQSPLALDLTETQLYIASNRASARLISLYCFCRQIRTLYVMGSFPQLLKQLALGRSTQAVAACFSMLQLAQEEQVGVSTEEMEQLMLALVRSLENNRSKNDTNDAIEDDNDSDNTAAKVNMGELFRPTVTVETTQTSGSVLEHGDIRVTLGIANDFPAGVQLGKVRVRFVRTPTAQQIEQQQPPDESTSTPPSLHDSFLPKNSSTLDDLVLNEETKIGVPAEANGENISAETSSTKEHNQLTPRTSTSMPELKGEIDQYPQTAHENYKNDADVLLEESNVHLDEKTGVNLVFIHSGVPVGQYTCTGIECVLAGNTFRLLPPSVLALASFEIGVKESTVQVAINGAPLLMPRSLTQVETIAVSIQAKDDMVSNGTLELCVFKRSSKGGYATQGSEEEVEGGEESGDEEECGVQFIGARLAEESDPGAIERMNVEQGNNADIYSNTLTVTLPPMAPGSSLSYVVSLLVPSIDHSAEPEGETQDASSITVRANVRYQRAVINSSTPTATTEIRCTESTFRVLQPLVETVKLKRVGARIFASIVLTCNPILPVAVRDYRFLCPGGASAGNNSVLTVEQDPNTTLRGTLLRPNDQLHLAFTLVCSSNFENEISGHSCSLHLQLNYDKDESWQKTMTVHVPLEEVEGKRYRVEVLPRGHEVTKKFTGEMVEASASDPVTFQIHVQEEVSQSNRGSLEDDTSTLSLCLNESSEHDWILVGKQLEHFRFDPCSGGNGDRRREFSTQKRFLATRAGQLRFPNFRLEINGQAIPAARVHCQQSSRRVLVS
ncbi:hypothetical protein PRNP1_001275 [Phytophthora ramorum]